jgi:hypothetical protein
VGAVTGESLYFGDRSDYSWNLGRDFCERIDSFHHRRACQEQAVRRGLGSDSQDLVMATHHPAFEAPIVPTGGASGHPEDQVVGRFFPQQERSGRLEKRARIVESLDLHLRRL